MNRFAGLTSPADVLIALRSLSGPPKTETVTDWRSPSSKRTVTSWDVNRSANLLADLLTGINNANIMKLFIDLALNESGCRVNLFSPDGSAIGVLNWNNTAWHGAKQAGDIRDCELADPRLVMGVQINAYLKDMAQYTDSFEFWHAMRFYHFGVGIRAAVYANRRAGKSIFDPANYPKHPYYAWYAYLGVGDVAETLTGVWPFTVEREVFSRAARFKATQVEGVVSFREGQVEPVSVEQRRDMRSVGDFKGDSLQPSEVGGVIDLSGFTFTDTSTRTIVINPTWVRNNITSAPNPFFPGKTLYFNKFAAAMPVALSLASKIANWKPTISCAAYVPRRIAVGKAVSNHAYGLAVDLDPKYNPYKAPLQTNIPEVFVRVMNCFGFAWGGDWQVPDAMHFEMVRVVQPDEARANLHNLFKK